MGIADYSATPANNTAISGINIDEACPPDGINNAIRQLMADVKAGVGTKGTDIASAASIDLGAATGQFVDVTGTTTITALGTVAAGTWRIVRFTGALTLTHNATSLILPGGANINAANGDIAAFLSLGAGNWLCASYQFAGATRAAFSADKAGTAQTAVTASTYVKITFTNEVFDIGGFYDAPNSRWTPPPGKYRITAACYVTSNVVDQAALIAAIYKNGAAHKQFVARGSGGNTHSVLVTAIVEANGTDYFEVYFQGGGAGDKTVDGPTDLTFFMGESI